MNIYSSLSYCESEFTFSDAKKKIVTHIYQKKKNQIGEKKLNKERAFSGGERFCHSVA